MLTTCMFIIYTTKQSHNIPFPKKPLVLCLHYKSFENSVEKRKFAHKE